MISSLFLIDTATSYAGKNIFVLINLIPRSLLDTKFLEIDIRPQWDIPLDNSTLILERHSAPGATFSYIQRCGVPAGKSAAYAAS